MCPSISFYTHPMPETPRSEVTVERTALEVHFDKPEIVSAADEYVPAPEPIVPKLYITIPDDEPFTPVPPDTHYAWRPHENVRSAEQVLRGQPPGTWMIRPSSSAVWEAMSAGRRYITISNVAENYDVTHRKFAWVEGKLYKLLPGDPPFLDLSFLPRDFSELDNVPGAATLAYNSKETHECDSTPRLDLREASVAIEPDGTVRNNRLDNLTNQFVHVAELSLREATFSPSITTQKFIEAATNWKNLWPRLRSIDLTGTSLDISLVKRAFPHLTILGEPASS